MSGTIQQFDFSVNILTALLWQHNDQTELISLLTQKNDWYAENQEAFWSNWFTDVFDIRTANEFGLSVWAVILGIPTSIVIPPSTKVNFGFGTSHKNFNQGNFGSQSSGISGLTLDQKRILLRLRYYQLVMSPRIPAINRMLKAVLGDEGTIYCLDPNDMSTLDYVLKFELNSALLYAIQDLDVLPRPAGVGITYRVLPYVTFGFGQYHANFNRGNFKS